MPEPVFEPVGPAGPQIFGIAIERDVIFSNHKGVYRKRIEKRQRKLFVKIPFLKLFLRRGEKILLVSTGYAPLGSLAQYLTGFLFSYLKRSIFVFTNYRIFHIPTTPSYNYKNSLAQIAYAGCQSIALKRGTLTVQYAKFGRVEKFMSIAVSERKKIKSLLKKTIPLSGTKAQLAGRAYLCPRCTHRLSAGKYACGNCQLKFKSKLLTAMLAIIIPGGGYFYTRYYLIGIINAVIELFLLVFIAVTLNDFRNGVQGSLTYLAVVAAIFVIVKIISAIHSAHFTQDFIPKDKKIKPMTSDLPDNQAPFKP
jgi:hypothetical protein